MERGPKHLFLTRRAPPLWVAVIAGGYLIFSLITLDDFGITWDEPVHFRTADLYREKILSREWNQISNLDFGYSMEYYGPFFDILASFNQLLFTGTLKLLAEDNARHLHLVVVAALTVLFTFLLTRQACSSRCAIFTAMFLVSFPRFIGHSFNNPKDLPLVFIFVVCLFLFYRRIQTKRIIYSILLAIVGGIGFATRIQYIILPIIILSYTIVTGLFDKYRSRGDENREKFAMDVFVALALSFPIGLIFWPYFWTDTMAKLIKIFNFYYFHEIQGDIRVIYASKYYIPGKDMPWHYAPVMLFITTPLITLGFFLLQFSVIIVNWIFSKPVMKKAKKKFTLLVLLWVILGIIPFMIPGQRIYGGIRHFLFVVPAVCIFAGMGLDYAVCTFEKRWGKKPAIIMVVLLFAINLVAVYSYHPYYTVYYNHLIGGPKGAFGRFSLENWGNAYKKGCLWLNGQAPLNSTVLVLVAPQIPRYYLRDDIKILGPEEAWLPLSFYDYSMYIIRDCDPLKLRSAKPDYEISVKGQPILRIHRWDLAAQSGRYSGHG